MLTLIMKYIKLISIIILFTQNSFASPISKIDIDKSFIIFNGEKNSFRSNIESVLISDDKIIYLLKECRAETIGKDPFINKAIYEFLPIVENNKTHFFRTSSVDGRKYSNLQLNAKTTNKKYIYKSNFNILNFDEAYKLITSSQVKKIFCEIEFTLENKKYRLITKCDMINYNTKTNEAKYLQPIMGYLPIIYKEKIRYGYGSLNLQKDTAGNLEFLLNSKTQIFDIYPNQKFIKKNIKKLLNKSLFFYKKNDFTEVIRAKNSNLNFLVYD